GTTVYNLVQGIVYAASHGARVINVSIAFASYAQSLQDSVTMAWNQGAVIVAAANNTGTEQTFYPAGMLHVVGVSATDSTDHLSGFSSYGPMVGVAAPGSAIIAATPTYHVTMNTTNHICNNYTITQDTSFSSPFVASLAATLPHA